jgi:serine/threonine-protein kinase
MIDDPDRPDENNPSPLPTAGDDASDDPWMTSLPPRDDDGPAAPRPPAPDEAGADDPDAVPDTADEPDSTKDSVAASGDSELDPPKDEPTDERDDDVAEVAVTPAIDIDLEVGATDAGDFADEVPGTDKAPGADADDPSTAEPNVAAPTSDIPELPQPDASEPSAEVSDGAEAVPADTSADPSIPPETADPSPKANDLIADGVGSASEDRTRIAESVVAAAGTAEDRTKIATPAPVAKPADTTPPTAKGNAPVPIGTLINNNYEIKELINAGGMGEVFRGVNSFTGDPVAIKIVLQALAHDEKIAGLFKREARVLCQLSDQAIVRYYNFVHDADLDRFCLIMEYIDGVPLSEHVRDVAPLTLTEAQGLLKRLALGLDRAHKMEVVHRDLSPDNVMLRDGKMEGAVLIDFGIAKSTEMAENTLHGQLAGKFKYISPEQLGHFGGEIGPRTDIYGLGLLMAAAVRGEPLDMGSSVVEAVNARREIPELTGVYPEIAPLLAHMLEPDPAHRPARMSDVINLLENPQDIPAKYGGARPMADPAQDRTVIRTAAPTTPTRAPSQTTLGLRQPPGRTATGIGTGVNTGVGGGISMVPGDLAGNDNSASPFDTREITGAPRPLSIPPAGGASPSRSRRRRRSSGIGGLVRWFVLLVMLSGIGAYFANRQGLLQPWLVQAGLLDQSSLPAPDAPGTDVATPDATEANTALIQTREGFLADFASGECTFATRIAAGRNAGQIEGFAAEANKFAGLPDAYQAAFETRPNVLERTVSPEQCAVLDLVRAIQGGEGAPPILTLDADVMKSGGSIVGQIRDRRGRPVWLVLISAKGGVYNLSGRLTEQADGSATFSFGLNAEAGQAEAAQLVLVVATDTPLINAAAAVDGASAAALMPLIGAEIQGRGGKAGAALGFFNLTP